MSLTASNNRPSDFVALGGAKKLIRQTKNDQNMQLPVHCTESPL